MRPSGWVAAEGAGESRALGSGPALPRPDSGTLGLLLALPVSLGAGLLPLGLL